MDLLFTNDKKGEYPPSWYEATKTEFPMLESARGDIPCDVAIVGAGFTGLSAALQLAKRGVSVVVVDAHRIGWGASGRNGGQLGMGQRVEQDELDTLMGVEASDALWQLGIDAVALVKSLITEYQIDCQLSEGIIHANHKKRLNSHSKSYIDLLKTRYDYHDLHYLDETAIAQYIDSPRYFGGTLDTNAAHLHPLNFVIGLAKAAIGHSAKIYENSLVTSIRNNTLLTENAAIKAKTIILATNGYGAELNDKTAKRVMPINNFIAVTKPLDEALAQSLIKNQHAVADSKFVVNYFRMIDSNRLLFGGGESYGYRFPKDIARFVHKPLSAIFPQLESVAIDYAWGGTLAITINRMPYVRRLNQTLYSASGYSGHGVGTATFCGKLMADAIIGEEEGFNIFSAIPTPPFIGSKWMRNPLLVLAMLYYRTIDCL